MQTMGYDATGDIDNLMNLKGLILEYWWRPISKYPRV
jgi:hypothetical protein